MSGLRQSVCWRYEWGVTWLVVAGCLTGEAFRRATLAGPRRSLAVRMLLLTIGKGLGGLSEELALLFAVQMVAVSQAFFEIPDGADHAVGGADEFIAGRRDPQREIADARQFTQECFRIEQPGVGHLPRGVCVLVPSAGVWNGREGAWKM